MKKIAVIEQDEEIYANLESLVFQLHFAQKNYPTALKELARNSGISIGRESFNKVISGADCKILTMAKLQVDKINYSLSQSYGK